MVLVTSGGFRGAYLNSGQSVSMTAIAGDGTAMERDYDYSSALHGADLETPEKVGRSAGERTVERLNPRKVETKRVPVVFDRRVAGSLVSHLAGAINGSAVARKTSFLKDKLGERLFAPGISVIDDPRRSAACARVPSMPRASRPGVSPWWKPACSSRGFSTRRPRANWNWRPPGTLSAACPRPRRPGRAIFISPPARSRRRR
jgi:hypothetical protein